MFSSLGFELRGSEFRVRGLGLDYESRSGHAEGSHKSQRKSGESLKGVGT
jgi:hypothetical protein